MKSFFLFTLLVTAMMASVASAQMSTRPSAKDMKPQKSTFDKFSERLKIGYFGVFTSPTIDDIADSHWDNAAISPEFSGGTNRDTWPTNVWHQLSFNYNYGGKLNFVVNPRFMTPLADPVSMKEPEDRSFIMLDDVLVGFQGVIASSEDKSVNFWIRAGIRLPTSRASRNGTNSGAGVLSHQNDLSYNLTWDVNKTWQLGWYGQLRQWVIEDHFDFSRFRIVSNPFIQYTINDSSRLILYYENLLETNRRGKPVGDRDPVFKDVWQTTMLGYSVDVTKKLNLMPFASVFINRPITDKSVYVGSWISYSIK